MDEAKAVRSETSKFAVELLAAAHAATCDEDHVDPLVSAFDTLPVDEPLSNTESAANESGSVIVNDNKTANGLSMLDSSVCEGVDGAGPFIRKSTTWAHVFVESTTTASVLQRQVAEIGAEG